MLDLGGDTLIVGRKEPKSTKRVARSDVRPARAQKPTPAPPKKTRPDRQRPDPQNLAIAASQHGMCALMRQSRPPTKTEMIEGQWSLCCTWLEAKKAPERGEPTCPKCRTILKLEPQ